MVQWITLKYSIRILDEIHNLFCANDADNDGLSTRSPRAAL